MFVVNYLRIPLINKTLPFAINFARPLSTVVTNSIPNVQNPTPIAPQTITKIIADTGICSRNEAEKFVQQGRVKINGVTCISQQYRTILGSSDSIEIDGVKLKRKYAIERPPRLWAVKKQSGELMSDSDRDKDRPLVISRLLKMLPKNDIKEHPNGFKPVYHLEFNTEGLCLYTNSGEFARVLNNDSTKFGRHYRVRVHGLITESKLEGLRSGLFVDGVKYKPMDVSVQTKAGTITWLNVTCYDNKNQSMKKSFEKLFLKITRSICVGFGPDFKLDEIIPVDTAVHCKEVKLTPVMNAMYLQMQNNHRGLAYKTQVKKDLSSGKTKKKSAESQEIATTF